MHKHKPFRLRRALGAKFYVQAEGKSMEVEKPFRAITKGYSTKPPFVRFDRFSDISLMGRRVRFCAGFSDAGITTVQALRRPASEKRQGRKSLRDRPLTRSAGAMGIWWWFRGLEGWRATIDAVGLGAWIGLGIGSKGCRVEWAVRVGADVMYRAEFRCCRR